MSPDLDKTLCAKYPLIFKNRHASPMESCFAFGFECGDGWYGVIDAMCEALTYTYTIGLELEGEDVKKFGKDFITVTPPQVICDQCKEKFGTLRFYHHTELDPQIQELAESGKYPDLRAILDRYHNFFGGIVHMAEVLSGRTCEVTGLPGEMHVSGGSRYGRYRTLNVEFAKTDPDCIERGYVPVSSLKEEKNESTST